MLSTGLACDALSEVGLETINVGGTNELGAVQQSHPFHARVRLLSLIGLARWYVFDAAQFACDILARLVGRARLKLHKRTRALRQSSAAMFNTRTEA